MLLAGIPAGPLDHAPFEVQAVNPIFQRRKWQEQEKATTAIEDGALQDQPLRVYGVVMVAVGGVLLMWLGVWRFADAVYDCGDHLLFRKGTTQQLVYLRNIESMAQDINPVRIRLRVRESGGSPREMHFEPKGTFFISTAGSRRVFEDLAKRVKQARDHASVA